MGLKLDGIATNAALDTSGEILDVTGHDISDLVEGRGVLNFEHEKGAEDIIGAVIYAKKILTEDDCENERQRKYWKLSHGPYVYVIVELFEDENHPGAVAVAAMVRYYARRREKMFMGFSIEGTTLERDSQVLKRSVGRRVAFTLRPCNRSAIFEVFEDPRLVDTVRKFECSPTNCEYEIDSPIYEDVYDNSDIISDLKKAITALNKTLTASGSGAAPSQLVGGAALIPSDIGTKNRIKAAVRDWNRTRPLKEAIKAALPEISDDYIDHFVTLAEDISLKKGLPAPKRVRVGFQDSDNLDADDAQKQLIEGLYLRGIPETYTPDHKSYSSVLEKLRNDAGDDVIVKPDIPDVTYDVGGLGGSAKRATIYYQLAKNFFGLGEYVPVTNYFKQKEGSLSQAIRHIAAKPLLGYSGGKGKLKKDTARFIEDGTVHKLSLMDLILGSGCDRHGGNVLVGSDRLFHIDNDDTFFYHHAPRSVYFLGDWDSALYVGDHNLHADAQNWLMALDAKKLVRLLSRYGVTRNIIKTAIQALSVAKKMAAQRATISKICGAIYDSTRTVHMPDLQRPESEE